MDVLKIVSSLAVVACATLLGFIKAKKLSEREYILREFVVFLNNLKNEIRYMLTILPNAYEIARIPLKTKLKNALGAISTDMLDSNEPFKIEKSITENILAIDELSEYDRSIIIATLKNLGMTNVEGQCNIIDNTISVIENQINEASMIKNKNSKMYRAVGALSGIILVIIFI